MCNPEPSHVGGIDHLGKVGYEVLVGGAEAGVDDHGLLGMKDIGVDGKEPESRNFAGVVEDRDIADPVNVHEAPPCAQKGTWVASSPQGWPPSVPGRPEMTRQKSAASMTISSPPVPELQLPPAGPVSSSR